MSVMTTLRILILAAAALGLSACSLNASITPPHISQKTTASQ